MTRLFLRFYTAILLTFLITMLSVLFWLLRETPEDRAVVEQSLRGGVSLAKESLRGLEGALRDAAVNRLADTFGYDVSIKSLDDPALNEGDRNQLLGSDGPVLRDDTIYSRLATDEILVMGPLPDFKFGSGAGWVLLLVGVAWALVSFALLRPVFRSSQRLETAATRMASGDLATRIDPAQVVPANLAEAFNSMAQTTERLVSEHRELIAAVSHEFRTPLARLRFAVELVARQQDAAEPSNALAEIDANVVELESLVSELLEFLRAEQPADGSMAKRFHPATVLQQLIERRATTNITVEFVCDQDVTSLHLQGERLFLRAVDNLLANACRHARSKVKLRFESADDRVCIQVSDDGPGIAKQDHERVFAPFVQLESDSSHRGFGLGLSIVKRVASSVGGSVTIDQAESGGAMLSLWWPLEFVRGNSKDPKSASAK